MKKKYLFPLFFSGLLYSHLSYIVYTTELSSKNHDTKVQKGEAATFKIDVQKNIDLGNKNVTVFSSEYFYNSDAKGTFLDLYHKFTNETRQYPSYKDLSKLWRNAVSRASITAPLTDWRENGGTNPYMIHFKTMLHNNADLIMTNIPVTLTIYLGLGKIYTQAYTQTINYNTLENTIHWITYRTISRKISALPVNEIATLEVRNIDIYQILNQYRNQWPLYIKTVVTVHIHDSTMEDNTTETMIKLIPHHFHPIQ